MGAFEGLLKQIDLFIKKYYKNQILRGSLLFLLVFLGAFLVVTLVEYFGRFNSIVRGVLFFGFMLLNLFILVKYFVIPLSKLFSFGKRISRGQASKIIGEFFPNIKDRLSNTLQLNANADENLGNVELLKASVAQRAKTLSAIPFTKAIDYKENKGYVKYLLPVLLLLLIIGVFLPKVFSEGTTRLVNYNQKYEIPAPFSFNLLTTDLSVEEGQPVTIDLEIIPKEGQELPAKVYIRNSRGLFLMQNKTKSKLSYTIPKVTSSEVFSFKSNGFESIPYNLNVVGKTAVNKLEARLNYPAYLGMKDKTIINAGDLVVPEGTKINWSVLTDNTKLVKVSTQGIVKEYKERGFSFNQTIKDAAKINFELVNAYVDKVDSLSYRIEVVKDAYPSISVNQVVDTIYKKKRFFTGDVEDDKGLRNVSFVYTITSKDGEKTTETRNLPGIRGAKASLNMTFDLSLLPLSLDDLVSYYFVVYDNDAVNGFKSSRSSTFSYKVPSSEELTEQRKETADAAKSSLKKLMKRSEEFNKRMKDLKKDLFENNETNWNQMQQLEQLKLEQKEIQKSLEKAKNELNESLEDKKQLSEVDEEMLEKQELIEELMNEMMDEEMLDLLEKLEEMMKNQSQEEMQKLLEEIELNNEDMNKNLDRTIEQLKKMQVNEQLDDLEKRLQELAEKQEELAGDLERNELSEEEAIKKQEELQEEFKKTEEKLDEILKENEDLERPMDLDDLKEDREEVKENQEETKSNAEKGKKSKSSESSKKAGDKMKEMAAKLDAMQEQSNEEQAQEDIDTLRGILENLMSLSFAQEFNMNSFMSTSILDPGFVTLGRAQRKLMDDHKPVEDSLVALAMRVPKIASFIDKELGIINMNFSDIPDDIDERRKKELGVKQQYVMTSMNNLALFLNETLQNMQNEMQSNKPGGGSCDKPGGGGKKGSSSKPMEGMKEMLKKQLKALEKGMNPGGNKPGDAPGQPMPMPFGNKQAAQMAAQQSAMREKLNQLKNELNKEGKGKGNQLNELLKELEEQEKSLVNKQWDVELVKRQKEILTRLLESEKALEERGFDEKRESKEGKSIEKGNQIDFLEYNKEKAQQIELLRSVSPDLERYYKDRASEYFNRVN